MKTLTMILCGAMSLVWVSIALAEPAVKIDLAAGECVLLNGNGVGEAADSGLQIKTNSNNNNAHLTCQADVTPPDTGRAAIFNFDNTGSLCGIAGIGTTDDWHNVVSKSGRAKLVCHIKN